MGEIDTKPIESVQAALSLFEEKSDHWKTQSTGSDKESEKERELEGVLKDLANYKVQLEAKDAAYMQALLKLQHHQYTADELSQLLENIEFERDKYVDECKEARAQIYRLESKVEEMADQLTETLKLREQLMHVFKELKATQSELLSMETELAESRDSELKAQTQAELMEAAFAMEKERAEELLRHVSELSEAVVMSKVRAEEKLALLREKDGEIVEDLKKEAGMMEELEDQLLAKPSLIEILQLEFKEVHERLDLSEQAASDAVNDLKELEEELEMKERKISDQEGFIEVLETEITQLKLEALDAKELANSLKCEAEMVSEELEKAKSKIDEVAERENKAQVEIAMLESELHRGRSKIAAAEARTDNVKSGYLAIQQLAIEAETAKMENRMLKQGELETEDLNAEEKAEEIKDGNDVQVTISLKEYESLIKKAEQADQIPLSIEDKADEVEILKNELEAAMEKVAQFRNRAEQATTRADLAERAKAALEDQIRIWRRVKEKRRAALAALREVTPPKQFSPPAYESPPQESTKATPASEDDEEESRKSYLALRDVLKMKF